MRSILTIATAICATALALSWLVLAEASPLSAWLWQSAMPTNIAAAANLPAFAIAVIGSGNVQVPGTAWIVGAMVGQWFVVGLLIGWGWTRLRARKAESARRGLTQARASTPT